MQNDHAVNVNAEMSDLARAVGVLHIGEGLHGLHEPSAAPAQAGIFGPAVAAPEPPILGAPGNLIQGGAHAGTDELKQLKTPAKKAKDHKVGVVPR